MRALRIPLGQSFPCDDFTPSGLQEHPAFGGRAYSRIAKPVVVSPRRLMLMPDGFSGLSRMTTVTSSSDAIGPPSSSSRSPA